MGKIGRAPKRAINKLIAELQHNDYWAKNNAAFILGKIRPVDSDVIPALSKALGDPQVMFTAVSALGDIGPDAEKAIHDIIKAFCSVRPDLKKPAATALLQIVKPQKDLKDFDVKELKDKENQLNEIEKNIFNNLNASDSEKLIIELKNLQAELKAVIEKSDNPFKGVIGIIIKPTEKSTDNKNLSNKN